MRELSINEIGFVTGGEITCTVGTSGANCTGSAQSWGDVLFKAYDDAKAATTDAIEAVANWFKSL
jgi:hypothetical protein